LLVVISWAEQAMAHMKRREVITLIGGAATWPLAASAQQPAMPVIGFLSGTSPETARLRAFRQGLKDAGFIEGENVAIEYRWADDQTDRLPALAAELAQRRVAVIAAIGGIPSALAATAATTTIPIVFLVGVDPVRLGLVSSLPRPGGNLTGINVINSELASKRLELLRALVPGAIRIGVLVDPTNASGTDATLRDVGAAARTMGLQIRRRRRGDRVSGEMSAGGTKLTCAPHRSMSAFGGKADSTRTFPECLLLIRRS
jgi:putative tryptophan/tyrosine transport system substrate-binding protein